MTFFPTLFFKTVKLTSNIRFLWTNVRPNKFLLETGKDLDLKIPNVCDTVMQVIGFFRRHEFLVQSHLPSRLSLIFRQFSLQWITETVENTNWMGENLNFCFFFQFKFTSGQFFNSAICWCTAGNGKIRIFSECEMSRSMSMENRAFTIFSLILSSSSWLNLFIHSANSLAACQLSF